MLRTKGRMRRPCSKCGETFEKHGKRQRLCMRCRNNAYKQGAETRRNINLPIQPNTFVPTKLEVYKTKFNVDRDLYNLIKPVIKEINEGKKEIQTQDTFIRRAIEFYIDLLKNTQRGDSFRPKPKQ